MIKQITYYVAICDVCGESVDHGRNCLESEALERALADKDRGGSGCKEINGQELQVKLF